MIFIVNLYNEVNQCYLKSVHQTSADFSYPYNKNRGTSALNYQICTTRFLSVYSGALPIHYIHWGPYTTCYLYTLTLFYNAKLFYLFCNANSIIYRFYNTKLTKKIKRNVRSISLKIIKKKVLTFQAFRNHLQKNKKQNVSKMLRTKKKVYFKSHTFEIASKKQYRKP